MIKFLFFDYRDYETVEGFVRELEPPRKYSGNPILVSDINEGGRMSLYGSVIHRPEDGLWQMWYSAQGGLRYAESGDGVNWHKPLLDAIKIEGKLTNLVFDQRPHGATIIYDEREQRAGWKYKMLAGAAPSNRISAFRSPDGIHWLPAFENPVIGTHPDCPMSLHRANDGRYVAYHRPRFGDRRVGRSESWDFIHWSEAKLVMEPDPNDPPQVQFYGLGACPYGAYEIGTLWIYHTVENDMDFHKMRGNQEPELVYCRSGYAWHRAAQGKSWIALGEPGSWEWGTIQVASAPVFLEDEVRFYYMGRRTEHRDYKYDGSKWDGSEPEPKCGIGFVSLKPDRFVSVTASSCEGTILTRPFWTDTPQFYANAVVRENGYLRVEVTDIDGKPIEGFLLGDCSPINGGSIYHRIRWRKPDTSKVANRQIRLHVTAKKAKLYSLFSSSEEELATHWKFRIPYFLDMEREKKLI